MTDNFLLNKKKKLINIPASDLLFMAEVDIELYGQNASIIFILENVYVAKVNCRNKNWPLKCRINNIYSGYGLIKINFICTQIHYF